MLEGRSARRRSKDAAPLLSPISRHPYLFAMLGYALILALFLAPALFQGKVFAAADYTLGSAPWRTHSPVGLTPVNSIRVDDGITEYPRKVKFYDAVQSGGIPFWDSYKLAGYPFYEGIGQSTIFTPLYIWLTVIPPEVFTGLYAFMRLLLAGMATFVFCRTLKISPLAAFFSGLVFMLSGPMVVWLTSVLVDMAFAFPALLACVEGLVSTGKRGWLIAIPPLVGWMFMLGYPPGLVHLIAVVAVYALVRLWQTRDVGAGETWTRLGLLVGASVLGLGIGAVGIHTMLTFLNLSPHGGRIEATQRLPGVTTLMLIYPNVFGREAWSTWQPRYPFGVAAWGGPWNSCALTSYMGLLPLVLAPFAVWRQWRTPAIRLVALMALVLGLIIWANPIPLHQLLALLPVVKAIVHTRLTIPFAMFVAVLAGVGLDELVRPNARARRRLLPGLVLTAVALSIFAVATYVNQAVSRTVVTPSVAASVPASVYQAAYRDLQVREAFIVPALVLVLLALLVLVARGRLSRGVALSLLIGFAAFDALFFGFGFNPMLDRREVLPSTQSVEGLARLAKGYRVAPVGDWAPMGLGDIASAYKIESIGGYDLMAFSPLSGMLQSVEPTFYPGPSAAGSELRRDANLPSPVLDALSVKYLVTDSAETSAVANVEGAGYRLVFEGDISVYENPKALPRAWSVKRVVGAVDRESQLVTVGDPEWDPRTLAVAGPDQAGLYSPASVKLRSWSQGAVELDVNADGDAFVVLSEMSIPEWKAEIDGTAAPVVTTDYALLGLKVPEGKHTVRFWYESPGFFTWGWVSIAFLAVWVGLTGAFFLVIRQRRIRSARSARRPSRPARA